MGRKLIILGAGGRMRTGKTSVCHHARELARHWRPNWDVFHLAFGDCLRSHLHTYYGMNKEHLTSDATKNTKLYDLGYTKLECSDAFLVLGNAPTVNMTVREVLQTVGHGHRVTCPSWWVDVWLDTIVRKIKEKTSGTLFVTVDDIRYFNEATAVRHCGGVVRAALSHIEVSSLLVQLLPPWDAPTPDPYLSEHPSENQFSVWKTPPVTSSNTGWCSPNKVEEAAALFDRTHRSTYGHHDRTAHMLMNTLMQEHE